MVDAGVFATLNVLNGSLRRPTGSETGLTPVTRGCPLSETTTNTSTVEVFALQSTVSVLCASVYPSTSPCRCLYTVVSRSR